MADPDGILIIADNFAPSSAIGGRRPTKLAAGLVKHGWKTHVLTLAESCYEHRDSSFSSAQLNGVSITRVSCGSPWIHSQRWNEHRGVGRLFAMGIRALARATQQFVPVDDLWPWVRRAAGAGENIVRQEPIKLIWVTVPRYSPLRLASRISARTGVPYVVDFRDVRRKAEMPLKNRRLEKAIEEEDRLLAHARGISYVAPAQIRQIRSMYPSVAGVPACFIPNWFEARSRPHVPLAGFGNPTILHGGSLYQGSRRLDGFLESLSNLTREERFKTLKFVHFGLRAEMPYVSKLVARYNVGGNVILKESVSASEFAALCRQAAVLLLLVGHNSGYDEHATAIPGKLYDYFAAARPILVLGPKGCDAGEIVRSVRRGMTVEDDSVNDISASLDKLLTHTESVVDLSDAAVSSYEASTVLTRKSQFLRQCLWGAKAGRVVLAADPAQPDAAF